MKKIQILAFTVLFALAGLVGHAQSFDGGLIAGVVTSQIDGTAMAGSTNSVARQGFSDASPAKDQPPGN